MTDRASTGQEAEHGAGGDNRPTAASPDDRSGPILPEPNAAPVSRSAAAGPQRERGDRTEEHRRRAAWKAGWRGRPVPVEVIGDAGAEAAWHRGAARRSIAVAAGLWVPGTARDVPAPVRRASRVAARSLEAFHAAQK